MTTHLRGPRGLTLPNQTSRSPGSRQPVPRLWGPSSICRSETLVLPTLPNWEEAPGVGVGGPYFKQLVSVSDAG